MKPHTKKDFGKILELLEIYSHVEVPCSEITGEVLTDECWPLRNPENWAIKITLGWLWRFFHNTVPDGHKVVQTCGNLACMNPTHHELEEV